MDTSLPYADDLSAEAKRQAQAIANAEATLASDLQWVMTSPRGRRIVFWLLTVAGVNRPSFNNSGSITAFNEGQRNVGLRLLARLNDVCYPSYLTMLEEQTQKAKT